MAGLYWGLRPPGPLFYMFASAAIGSLPYNGQWFLSLGVAVASAAFSVLLGLAGSWIGEGLHIKQPVVAPMPFSHAQVLEQGAIYCGVALVAGLMGELIGLSHSYWAMIAGSAVVAPNVRARIYRGTLRVLGTFGGVLITAFFVSMEPDMWHVAVLVITGQFLAEIFVMRNYGIAMLFVTPMALFMIYLVQPFTSYELLTTRMIETLVGALVGVLAVLITRSPDKVGQDTVSIPIVRVARNYKGAVRNDFGR